MGYLVPLYPAMSSYTAHQSFFGLANFSDAQSTYFYSKLPSLALPGA